MQMKKYNIQIIGNYIAPELNFYGEVIVNDILRGISPFTLIGEPDKNIIDENLENFSNSYSVLFDILKNFPRTIERNKDKYVSNIKYVQGGKNIEQYNENDYIIIDNSSALYKVVRFNNRLYTKSYMTKEFINNIEKEKHATIIDPINDKTFNWKKYYDLFIETLLKQYDSMHIILIKTPSHRCYIEDLSVNYFDKKSENYYNFISEVDDYFIEKTNCIYILDALNYIPNKYIKNYFPYGTSLSECYAVIAKKIINIIENDNYLIPQSYSNKLVKFYNQALNYKSYNNNFELFSYMEDKMVDSFETLPKELRNKYSEFINRIYFFEKTLGKNNLIDIVLKTQNNIHELMLFLEKYTELYRCNVDEIFCIYDLYTKCDQKNMFYNIVKNLCDDQDINYSNQHSLFINNIDFLKKYEYINKDLLNYEEPHKIKYINVEKNIYLILNYESNNFMYLKNINSDNLNIDKIINSKYQCNLSEAIKIINNFSFYIRKAKRKEENIPITLVFNDIKEFYNSLLILDYKELLLNEKFIIETPKHKLKYDKYNIDDFINITRMGFLFDNMTKIIRISGGLGDQACYYGLGCVMKELKGYDIYYDDLECTSFNGLEIYKISSCDIKLISEYLSNSLKRQVTKTKSFPELLYENGISDLTIMSSNKKVYDVYYSEIKKIYANDRKEIIWMDKQVLYYWSLYRLEWLIADFGIDIKKFFSFPELVGSTNITIRNDMLSTDSIVIHVRRGDYVSWGWDVDNDFYIESVEKVERIKEYKNKKYFIFSDDIKWCKEHRKEIGINGKDNVEFIEGNKKENSYMDLQLMTYGKVIIASFSYFPKLAAILSERCELLLCAHKNFMDIYNSSIKKNKYDVGKYLKKYSINYDSRTPKINNTN